MRVEVVELARREGSHTVITPADTAASYSSVPAVVRAMIELKPASSPCGVASGHVSPTTMSAASPIASGQILHRD